MRRGGFSRNPIAFVVVFVSVSCLLVLILSVLRLPETSFGNSAVNSSMLKMKSSKLRESNERIGKFGEMMIEMLPEDLAFTIFMPSERAFERDLRLRVTDSLVAEKANDTYAILTHILGFTVVPWKIPSISVPFGEDITCDSISGFKLFVSKDSEGKLIVNGVRSEQVDLRKREIIVQLMSGVIMEAEFEQSVQPDEDEQD